MSKSYFKGQVIKYTLFLIFCVFTFWLGSGNFFTEEYYYPQVVLVMPIGFVVCLILLLREIIEFRKHKVIVSLNDIGIQVYEKPMKHLGLVKWCDITDFTEFAVPGKRSGRKILLFSNAQSSYIDRIPNLKRKNYLNHSEDNNDAILWLETQKLDCNASNLKNDIKKFIDLNK